MRAKELEEMYNLEKDHWWFRGKIELIESFFKIYSKPGLLLDIGCGTGFSLSVFEKHTEVIGVDSSRIALDFCKKRGLKNLKKGEAEKLPFGDNHFDTILALDLLEHTDDEVVLREIYRTLKKDGTLILTAPALMSLWTKHDEIFQHKRRYHKKELEQKLKKQGFIIKKLSYWNFILFPLAVFYKKSNEKSHIQPAPKTINRILRFALSVDNKLIKFFNLPYGISIVGVAKK